MLEQSALHGRVYHSEIMEKTLASKPAAVTDIEFGPMRPIQVYRVSDKEMWVQDKCRGTWYHYLGRREDLNLNLENAYHPDAIRISDYVSGDGFFYYYGKALYHVRKKECEKEEHFYFVQNEPKVTYDGIPDTQTMQMPLTLQAMDYEQTFCYLKEIKRLLSHVPASYVDRYKRPIKKVHGRTYPIPIEQVETTWQDLPETTYPIVINFGKTKFGVADLEPEHTADDLTHFNSLPGFYEEETPRGGKHKVVRINDGAFKFRYSKGLEIINQSQVTLYGINARWITDEPQILNVSSYHAVGHAEHQVNARLERPDVSKEVKMLRKKAKENLSTGVVIATKLYQKDTDDSHGEYWALYNLYEQDVMPYAKQFDRDLLPWILEAYAGDVICHREKHETLRQGLPYLVYLSAIIIGKKEGYKYEKTCENVYHTDEAVGNS